MKYKEIFVHGCRHRWKYVERKIGAVPIFKRGDRRRLQIPLCAASATPAVRLDITVEVFRPTWRYKILKNESKYHRKNSQRKFKGKSLFARYPEICFSRLFFFTIPSTTGKRLIGFRYTDSEKRVTVVTQVTRELMKNVSESTSYRWKVFGIDGSFLRPDEILDKSTQVSFECAVLEGKKLRDQRRWYGLPVATVCDVNQVSWIPKQNFASRSG